MMGGSSIRTVAGQEPPMGRAAAATGGPMEDAAPAGETRTVVIDKKPDGGFAVTCVKSSGASVPSEYPDLASALQYAESEFGGAAPAAAGPEAPPAGPTPAGAEMPA
jgi:hypothetical protein